METDQLFDERCVILNLEAENKEEVLTAMYEKLYAAGKAKESFLENVIKREKVFPTGLRIGTYDIAIPHTESEHVNKSGIAVATLKNPVEFERMDDPDETAAAKIVFMMALKDGHDHIAMISRIVKMFQKQNVLSGLHEAQTKNEIVNIIQKNL